jgi:hypothetical protein
MKMKKLVLFCVLIFAAYIAESQTTITGSVKDNKGNPLHFVFVGNNNEDKVATFTDSLGNFTMQINKAKGLYFNLSGYKDTSVNIGTNTSLNVVLSQGAPSSQQAVAALPVQQYNSADQIATFATGGYIAPTHQQGALHGNRYLYNKFVHGFVINVSGALVHNEGYLFDYDKIGGLLMLTTNNKNVTLISWDLAKSFTLFNDHDKTLRFTQVPDIDKTHYLQVLASGGKYSIYKLIKTTFVKADYENNGISSHGNDYDEYVDDADYYAFDNQTNQYQKFSLRKKSIKEAFAKDADKVNKFMSDHSNDNIDDTYLTDLGAYLNQ